MGKKKRVKEFNILIKQGKPIEDICNILDISKRTYYYYLKEQDYVMDEVPKPLVSIKDLKVLRRKVFDHKKIKEGYYNNSNITLNSNKAIGILHLGDLHLDSDGVDLDLIDHHIDLLRTTEGLYGGNLGDSTNNWIGFLGKLYGEQHTTVDEAIELVKHYLSDTNFLYTIIGNHDNWNSGAGLIHSAVNSGIVGEDIRFTLNFPNGTTTTVHARHHFKGSSMYNPAQGAVKEAMMGSRDDIVIHGHIHSLGYSVVSNAEKRKLQHCISVGSYKQIDSYKTLMGFRENNLSPSCVTVIDPSLDESNPDRIKVFFTVESGIQYLNNLRNK
jgi:UDP-2,3-diacylglucosamine pyrophosphatase LpxH